MEKLQLIWSGETELPAGWELQSHTHDFFHLAYIKRGNLIFNADGEDYHLSEGSMILIPPFVVHGIPQDTHNLCIQYEVFFQILNPELKHLFESQNVFVSYDASHLESQFSYIYMNYRSTELVKGARRKPKTVILSKRSASKDLRTEKRNTVCTMYISFPTGTILSYISV